MVLEVIKKRQSVRSYQDKEIPEEILQDILQAGRLTPSANNQQCWKFIVIKDKDIKEKLIPACKNKEFVGAAPVVIAGCATNLEHIMSNGEYSYPIDMAIALDHISLDATSLGLGTCWICDFYQDQVREILGVPKNVRVIALMTLGYPKDFAPKTTRKPLSEIICYNKYL